MTDDLLANRPAPFISVDVAADAYSGPDSILAVLKAKVLGASRAYAAAAADAAASVVRRAFGEAAHRALFEQSECDADDESCLHINLRLVTAADGSVLWYDNGSGLVGTALVAARDEDEARGGPVLAVLDPDTEQAIIDLIGSAEVVSSGYLARERLIIDPATEEEYGGWRGLIVLSLSAPAQQG